MTAPPDPSTGSEAPSDAGAAPGGAAPGAPAPPPPPRERIEISPRLSIPLAEVRFRTSRSGGPGGQNVNKTETRVELIFSVDGSPSFDAETRQRLRSALAGRLDAEGRLRVTSSVHRSQLANKKAAIARFQSLLQGALAPRKRRRKTRPSKASQARRMDKKQKHGAAKRLRRRPAIDP